MLPTRLPAVGCLYHLKRLCTAAHGRDSHSLVTTPIFYVNAAPHIGHLYSALLADASHRWQVIKGADPALFSTGTDEHGMKVQKAAEEKGANCLQFCDEVSKKFKDLFLLADISFTDYIRTTEHRHRQQVEHFWQLLHDRGHIYKGTYEGWYCVSDETFLSSSQITDGPLPNTKVSLESGHPVEKSSEENYLFRLSAFKEQLLDWVNTEPYPVIPETARQIVVNMVKNENENSDLSVSRPSSRLSWGIPVPNDDSQTIYVWLDALVNYLTVSTYPNPNHSWPATAHIVGKDILKFHAVYWPAFLLAAGLEPPRRIVTHAHWTVGKTKMSKSKGNVVDPFEQLHTYGKDAVRYYLLKEGSLNHDGDYSTSRLAVTANADLGDTLGNLLSRILSVKLNPAGPGFKFSTQLFPLERNLRNQEGVMATDKDYELLDALIQLPGIVDQCHENYQFNRGIEEIMACLYLTNEFIQRSNPWKCTSPEHQSWLQTILCVSVESLRLCSCLLSPIIPHMSTRILQRLGCSPTTSSLNNARKVYGSSSRHSVDYVAYVPDKNELECKLQDEDGVLFLENRSKSLVIGGQPLFHKLKTR